MVEMTHAYEPEMCYKISSKLHKVQFGFENRLMCAITTKCCADNHEYAIVETHMKTT